MPRNGIDRKTVSHAEGVDKSDTQGEGEGKKQCK